MNILFVDDEPKVLMGIQRLLRPMRNEWNVLVAESARKALDIMKTTKIDVIVSDMMMPEINGAQLLNEVAGLYPDIIRIVLSGHSDQELIYSLVGPAHQYLSKPCDLNILKDTINRAISLKQLLGSEPLKKAISQIDALPTLPNLYLQLLNELQSNEPSMDRVGEIISKDIAMSAKILQLVNSAFFGLPQKIASPTEAALYLGIETIKALVLSIQLFKQFDTETVKAFSLESLWSHSWTTAVLARKIATLEKMDQKTTDLSFSSALLHDIGKLILVKNLPAQFQESISLARQENIPHWEAEQKIFGVSHAEIGGYLLGIWGIQNNLVEAVSLHHRPQFYQTNGLSVIIIVHLANALDHEKHLPDPSKLKNHLDLNWLNNSEFKEKFNNWRELLWKTD